jgi:hypothetical protein
MEALSVQMMKDYITILRESRDKTPQEKKDLLHSFTSKTEHQHHGVITLISIIATLSNDRHNLSRHSSDILKEPIFIKLFTLNERISCISDLSTMPRNFQQNLKPLIEFNAFPNNVQTFLTRFQASIDSFVKIFSIPIY